MKMKLMFAVAALVAATEPVMSAHGNSWAGEGDAPVAANHDANQSRSANTPGTDEMNGFGARSAHGKNGTTPTGGTASDNSGLGEGGGPSGFSGSGSGRGGQGGNR
ncbi:hypothetical protein ACFORG_09645 [Lutimaribacter marinistellae]|uniref:Uncharacterized protein n=1 Tax=Lutimaribacter marinistellae TaxID=1820329 RepID=A0ABV7TJN6_9RHOB